MPRRSLEQSTQAFSSLAPDESKSKSRASRSGEASLPPKEAKTETDAPLFEDETSVSYLGVRLEKALLSDSPFIPDRFKFSDYVSDEYALRLQQKMALAMSLGEPVLIEGGTSLGKTTTALKMASDLGYEVYYINLNGNADVESLMGKYIPNAERKRDPQTGQVLDSEYKFADGQVTSALRQEEGKIKMVILDEINATSPEVLKRLNEILNAIERDTEIILTEDASERVDVSKNKTKVIGLMNPSGQGYLGVNPLSKELIARWIYQKEPEQLPHQSFTYRRKARRGQLPLVETSVSSSAFLKTPEVSLPTGLESLSDIPGYDAIEDLFDEFHHSAKELLKERRLAGSQTQEFIFEDNRQLRRFQEFILKFYSPEQDNLNQIVAKALEYFYLNMLESDEDKKTLKELANKVRYEAPKSTKRKGLKEENQATEEENQEYPNLIKTKHYLKVGEVGEEKDIEIDFETILKQAKVFYENHDIKLPEDFETQARQIWTRNYEAITKEVATYGYDHLLIIPDNLSDLESLHDKMTAGYTETYQSDNFKTGGSFAGVKNSESKNQTFHLTLLHQADAQNLKDHPLLQATLGKSPEQFTGKTKAELEALIEQQADLPINFELENVSFGSDEDTSSNQLQAEGLSLEEYLIWQRQYFATEKKHLDETGWTWLPASASARHLVNAFWDPGLGRLRVSARAVAYSDDSLGVRPSRSFR